MLIYVIAGEPSGDLLGGRLMAALTCETQGSVHFAGIGGRSMTEQGMTSLFPMSDLTVMGLVEVLPRIPKILKRVRQTVEHIKALRPDAVVTIDSWGFTGRVQTALKKECPDIPRIHYVAPMVWAWKPKRAKSLAHVLDMLMTLLPFEPEWFSREGLETHHVGHPVIESGADQGQGERFRQSHGLTASQSLITVLPGSRTSEVSRLLPVFKAAVEELAARHPGLIIAVPTVETVSRIVRQEVQGWSVPAIIIEDRRETYDAFAASRAALAASGTVALELAMAGLPSVIAYRVSPVTAWLAQRVMGLKIKWASLPNMVMDRPIMPECLQENCIPANLVRALDPFLDPSFSPESIRQDLAEAMRRLGYGEKSPGQWAARTLLDYIGRKAGS